MALINPMNQSTLKEADLNRRRMLPLISVLAAIGVVLLSIGYSAGRSASVWATPLFWLGLSMVFVPVAVGFTAPGLTRREILGLLVIFAVGSYLVKYLYSPAVLVSFDELLHWRTAYNILQTKYLFTPNPLLPVSPFYPGIESAVGALASLSGLSIETASALVLLASRLIMLMSLFLLFEHISHSARLAGIATLIYTGSSTFLFFDAQFSYESLALPLACMSIYMLLRRDSTGGYDRWGWNVLIASVLLSIVSTHHMTAFVLTIFLILWSIIDLYAQRHGQPGNNPIWMAAWLVLLNIIWLEKVSTNTVIYLSQIMKGAIESLYDLATGQSPARKLFEDSAGQGADLVERMIAILAVLLLLSSLIIGLRYWKSRYRYQTMPLILALCALVYPAMPVMRFSSEAWELSNRMAGYIFVALGFVAGLGVTESSRLVKNQAVWRSVVVAGLTIIFFGGIIAGKSPQTRLPQPYQPASEERSIDEQSVMAAQWAHQVLGPDNRMAADRTLTSLMGAYGTQRMIVNLNDRVSVSGLFLKNELDASDMSLISEMRIRYLAIDRRIKDAVPLLGYYFEEWEQLIVRYTPPVNIAVLDKFDQIPGVSRVFDSGDIVIYDLEPLIR